MSDQNEYTKKIKTLMEESRQYREKIRELEEKARREEKNMKSQFDHMMNLELKYKDLKN